MLTTGRSGGSIGAMLAVLVVIHSASAAPPDGAVKVRGVRDSIAAEGAQKGASAKSLLEIADEAISSAGGTTLDVWLESKNGPRAVEVRPGMVVEYRIHGLLSDDANEGLALVGLSLAFDGGDLEQADSPTGDPDSGCENPMIHFTKPWGITNPAGYGGTVIDGQLIQIGGGQNTINNTRENADFPIGPVLTGVAQPGGCGPAILVTGRLTAPRAEGTYQLRIFDVFANVIKQGETGEPFWATEAALVGNVGNLQVVVRDRKPVREPDPKAHLGGRSARD